MNFNATVMQPCLVRAFSVSAIETAELKANSRTPPVNDRATVGAMGEVHAAVGRGGTLPEGWLAARQGATAPLDRATAAAFTAWGA